MRPRRMKAFLRRAAGRPGLTRCLKPMIGGAAVAIVVLAVPGVASATTTTPSSSFYSYLWIAPLSGAVVAIIVVGVAAILTWGKAGRKTPIKSVSAWDFKDSWVTNLTALGTALAAVFTQSAATGFLVKVNSGDKDGFTVMSLLLGGVALIAPVVYGAFSRSAADQAKSDQRSSQYLMPTFAPPDQAQSDQPTDQADSKQPTDQGPAGTYHGLLLANWVTLLATFGLLSNIGLFVSDTIATGTEKGVVYGGLGGAALAVAFYTWQATKAIVEGYSLVSSKPSGTL